ncbi:MAG TPA: FAD-dependent monooxygenase [Candidatus Melainabacteria bacterium]|nr:FAD-dependent monooxygenase [Candidatus Melainabacteria bacterium]
MAPDSQEKAVLIVGAGPTGLMLACELQRHGIACRVIDKATVASDKSRALVLHARTLEILESMGMVEGFIESGCPAYGASLYHQGERIVHLDMSELDSPFPFSLMIPQTDTERLLTERFTRHGGLIERGVELTKFSQGKGGITVTIKNAKGKEEVIVADWMIGTDGAHSTVRKILELPFEGSAYEERFGLVDCHVKSDLPDDEISTFFHEDGVFVFFPLGKKRFRIVVNISPQQVIGDAPSLDDMQSFADRRGPGNIKLHDPVWLAWFTIHQRSVPKYRVGRVFLAGDSAHIHSPIGGQGMNTGMQDAFNLAWKLALVIRGRGADNILDSYNEERHPVGQELLKGTDVATSVATLKNPLAQQIRNHVMSFLSQQEVIQQRMRKVGSMLAVNYRSSPIVGEKRDLGEIQIKPSDDSEKPSIPGYIEFGRGPLPGDRAPDAVMVDQDMNPIRVYEAIRGISHNLLLLDGKPTEAGYRNLEKIAWSVGEQFGGLVTCHLILATEKMPSLRFPGKVFLDPDLAVHQTYCADSECLYLIRPDGYIGFRGQPAKLGPLEDHLNKLLKAARVQSK